MMQLHQLLKARLFTKADYLNANFLNIQDVKPRIGLIPGTLYTIRGLLIRVWHNFFILFE